MKYTKRSYLPDVTCKNISGKWCQVFNSSTCQEILQVDVNFSDWFTDNYSEVLKFQDSKRCIESTLPGVLKN